MPDPEAPHAPPAPPSPEDALEPVRGQAHEEPGLAQKVAELESRLAAREQEHQAKLADRERELMDRLARLQADFENHRRRAREESTAAAARGKEALLKALLPLLDNLDRALAHSEDEGLKLLARQLHGALQSQGVTILAPEGEAFDAKLHEAIAQETRDGVESGTVLTVVEKGYAMDGRVLRPARVVVAA